MRNVLFGLLLVLGALMALDGVRRTAHPTRPSNVGAAPAPVTLADSDRSSQVAPPPVTSTPAPEAQEPSSATPALDLYARLAVRRRIAREGDRVFLDSLFPHNDSVVARWFERPTLSVALTTDTALARWNPALLEDVRAGMRAWNETGVSPTLREATATDTADITVRWTDLLTERGQVGETTLSWSPDGIVHHANVTLALRRNTDSLPVPPEMRARVATHELGHALGLPHSNDIDDIMFRSALVAVPSSRDEATLRLLYVLYPGPLRAMP